MHQHVKPMLAAALWALLALPHLSAPGIAAAEEADPPPEPVTTEDPAIPVAELELLLKPLTKSELLVEAEAWQGLVKAKAEEIARAEILVQRQNREIEAAAAIQKEAEAAQEQLEIVAEQADKAEATGDKDALAESRAAAEEAKEAMDAVAEKVDEASEAARRSAEVKGELAEETKQGLKETDAAADEAKAAVSRVSESIDTVTSEGTSSPEEAAETVRAATHDAEAATQRLRDSAEETLTTPEPTSEPVPEPVPEATPESVSEPTPEAHAAVSSAAEAMAQAQIEKREEKVELLGNVNDLREERTQLLDRLRAVLDELEGKTDPEDSATLATIRDYRLYATSVAGIRLDITDTTSAWVAIQGWLLSEEGGQRWLRNIATFFGVLIVAWILSRMLSGGVHRALRASGKASQLLEQFLVGAVRWVVMIGGILMALAALEISIGPMLALVGAAGFVVAFALQDSLSNFASGLMILAFRPFDVGDAVEAGGVSGKVQSLNLVSTTIKTFDNQVMVIPNNKIWNDVITNITGVTTRRVDMEFGIGYADDIDKAQAILTEIVSNHPKVLADPEPTIRLNTLADSSVNFVCRPWANTEDYWEVYWDVTKTVKQRFDAEGIGIPFPQQDVHLYLADAGAAARVKALAAGRPDARGGPAAQPFEHEDDQTQSGAD